MSRVTALRSVGLGLTVLLLVGGAALVGREAADPAAAAEERLERYYAETDAAAVADRIVAGSLGQQVGREQLEAGLERLLQEPFEVEETATHTVRGVRLVRVRVARPQDGRSLDWCVLPGGALLLGCRVATADLTGRADGAVELGFAAMDLQPTTVLLAVVLTTDGEEPVPLGQPHLRGDGFDLVDASVVLGGRQAPADPEDLQVRRGAGLQLVWRAEDVDDLTAYTQRPFTLTWEGGSMRLRVDEVTWYVEAGGAPAAGPTGTASPS